MLNPSIHASTAPHQHPGTAGCPPHPIYVLPDHPVHLGAPHGPLWSLVQLDVQILLL